MTLESDSNCIVKDSGSSTITHVDIEGDSRSDSESSHFILQDLLCDFCFTLLLLLLLFYFTLVLVFQLCFCHFFVLLLVFVNKFVIFSSYTIFVFINENHTDHSP